MSTSLPPLTKAKHLTSNKTLSDFNALELVGYTRKMDRLWVLIRQSIPVDPTKYPQRSAELSEAYRISEEINVYVSKAQPYFVGTRHAEKLANLEKQIGDSSGELMRVARVFQLFVKHETLHQTFAGIDSEIHRLSEMGVCAPSVIDGVKSHIDSFSAVVKLFVEEIDESELSECKPLKRIAKKGDLLRSRFNELTIKNRNATTAVSKPIATLISQGDSTEHILAEHDLLRQKHISLHSKVKAMLGKEAVELREIAEVRHEIVRFYKEVRAHRMILEGSSLNEREDLKKLAASPLVIAGDFDQCLANIIRCAELGLQEIEQEIRFLNLTEEINLEKLQSIQEQIAGYKKVIEQIGSYFVLKSSHYWGDLGVARLGIVEGFFKRHLRRLITEDPCSSFDLKTASLRSYSTSLTTLSTITETEEDD